LSVYIIAEAGSNFDGKLAQAKQLIDVAVDAKADAVKFQMFRAAVLYPDKTQPVHARVKDVELPREWLGELMAHAKKKDIDFLMTPFDAEAIDLLEKADVKAYKWGSSETTNHRLLLKAARTRKPVYLSTGMCTMADIAEAVEILDANGCPEVTILHCYAVYPTAYEDAQLRVMETLRRAFGKPVGFSDHSLGIALPIAAAALGAKVIEKHFTLDRTLKGPDHSYALEPGELKEMIAQIRNVEKAMGSSEKKMHADETAWGRRDGLYAKRAIKKGQTLAASDLLIKRPATSLASRYQASVVGMTAKSNLKEGDPIHWKDVE
jgi:N,N'-diacetyllegionaminate synthase